MIWILTDSRKNEMKRVSMFISFSANLLHRVLMLQPMLAVLRFRLC